MSPISRFPVKRVFLYLLIGSVGISALLGILVILIGDFGRFETRVLLTTLTISVASICGLSCGAAWESRRLQVLPLVGIGLSVLAALCWIAGIWTDVFSDFFWRVTATFTVFAAAVSQVSLLRLARLSDQFRWLVPTTYVVVLAAPVIVSVMIWGEVDESTMIRLLGCAGILSAAVTVLTPVLHRLSRGFDATQHQDSLPIADVEREIRELEARLKVLRETERRLKGETSAVPLEGTGAV